VLCAGAGTLQKQRTVRETALETELRAAQAELVRIRYVDAAPAKGRRTWVWVGVDQGMTHVTCATSILQLGPGPAAACTRPSYVASAAG
jgi:hypothetical protein